MERTELIAWLALAVNIWIAWQTRPPPGPPPGRHRKKR